MSKPKCPMCDTSEHVHLVTTFTKAGAVAGAAAGAVVDKIRGQYKCSKCDHEFEADAD